MISTYTLLLHQFLGFKFNLNEAAAAVICEVIKKTHQDEISDDAKL